MPRTASSCAGFTLLELMVVVLIMGLAAGLISVSLTPDPRALLREDAERVAQLARAAITEARMTGHAVGVTAEAGRYRFWRLTEGQWREMRDDDLLRARALPAGTAISIRSIENRRVLSTQRLVFAPAGLSMAFEIELVSDAGSVQVTGSPVGEIQVVTSEGAGGGERANR